MSPSAKSFNHWSIYCDKNKTMLSLREPYKVIKVKDISICIPSKNFAKTLKFIENWPLHLPNESQARIPVEFQQFSVKWTILVEFQQFPVEWTILVVFLQNSNSLIPVKWTILVEFWQNINSFQWNELFKWNWVTTTVSSPKFHCKSGKIKASCTTAHSGQSLPQAC